MNLLLELVRLRLNRHDDVGRWTVLIRAHLTEAGRQSQRRRHLADPVTVDPSTGERV